MLIVLTTQTLTFILQIKFTDGALSSKSVLMLRQHAQETYIQYTLTNNTILNNFYKFYKQLEQRLIQFLNRVDL